MSVADDGAARFLQADPEEVPHPGRQVEGCNIAGSNAGGNVCSDNSGDPTPEQE